MISFFAWSVERQISKESRIELQRNLETVLTTTHLAIKSWVKENEANARFWSGTQEIQNAAKALLPYSHDRQSLLASEAQANLRSRFPQWQSQGDYRGYSIIGPDNITLASSRDRNVGVPHPLAIQPKFLEHVRNGNTAVSLPQMSDIPLPDRAGRLREGLPTMFVGAPIRDEAGGVIAIFTFRINPEENFAVILREGYFGQNGETYAFDDRGRLISDSRFNDQLRRIGLISPEERPIFNIEIRDPGVVLLQAEKTQPPGSERPLTRMAASALSGQSGVDVRGYRDYRGVTVIGAWHWDDELGFGIATESDKGEAYQNLRRTQFTILALTLLIVFLIVATTVIFTIYRQRRRIEQALRQSETRFRAQYQAIPAPIYTWRKQGQDFALVEYNAAAGDMTGGTIANLLGKTFHEIYADDPNRAELEKDIELCLAKQITVRKEMEYKLRTTGEPKFFDVVYVPLPPDLVMVHTYDLTRRKRAEDALRRSEVFELLATGASLGDILNSLAVNAQKHNPDMLCSILLLDRDRKHLRHGAAPNLPDFYNRAIDGIEIGLNTGSCGAAAFRGERVIVEDIMTHPNWRAYSSLAEKAELRACWSEPIFSSTGGVLGTFAIYHRTARKPLQTDLNFIHDSASLAGIAIERRQAEEALRYERDRAQRYLDTVEAIIVALDTRGDIKLINRKGCEILGVGEQELLGKSWFEHCLPQGGNKERVLKTFQDVVSGNLDAVEYHENKVITHCGEERLIAWHNNVIRDSDNNITGTLSAGEDITERRRMEEEARQHQAELAHMARLNTMGEMATGIAHELNQPLTAIYNYASAARNMVTSQVTPSERLPQVLKAIGTQAMRASEIIGRLRQFVKKQEPQMTSVSLNDLAKEVVSFTQSDIRKHHVQLHLELGAELPKVHADAIQIEQVLVNLVRNSMDAMEHANSEIRHLLIRTHYIDEATVQAEVTDTGPGMDAETLRHIFEPFVTSKGTKGLGVGLSISQSIIKAHGGRLWAESEAGKGARFFFTLPLHVSTSHEKKSATAGNSQQVYQQQILR